MQAEADEAGRARSAAEEALRKHRVESREVEAEHSRLEAEGPASHRKKDMLDKATKEVGVGKALCSAAASAYVRVNEGFLCSLGKGRAAGWKCFQEGCFACQAVSGARRLQKGCKKVQEGCFACQAVPGARKVFGDPQVAGRALDRAATQMAGRGSGKKRGVWGNTLPLSLIVR